MPFPVGLALGLAQGGISALGSVGEFFSGQSAARAQNRQAMKIYKRQMQNQVDEYSRAIAGYNLRKVQYQEQVSNNFTAAGRAYAGEQQRLNEIFKQQAFERQASNIDRVQESGKIAASGRSGVSAARMQAMAEASAGRNEAIAMEQRDQAIRMTRFRGETIRDQLKADNRNAYWNVGAPPVMGRFAPAPMQQEGPSGMSLFASLGQAAIGGFDAYNKFKNYGKEE